MLHDRNQVALWVNTRQKYTYALMEPEEQIAVQWAYVCESWRESDARKLPVPFCGPIPTVVSVPAWWHRGGKTAGKRAWQFLVTKQTEHENTTSRDDETPPPTPPTKTKKGRRKGNSAVPAKRKREQSSTRGTGSPQRSDETRRIATRGSNRMSVKPAVKWPPTDESESGSEKSATHDEDEAPLDVSADDTGAIPTHPPERSGVMTVKELAAPTSPPAAVVSPGKQASKDRLQREAEPSYSPGPSTQKANTLPPLTTDGVPPVVVFVPASSSPVEQGTRAGTQVRSTQRRADHTTLLSRSPLAVASSEPRIAARSGGQRLILR